MSLSLALPISSRSIACPQPVASPDITAAAGGPHALALPQLGHTAAHGTGASCGSTLQPPFRRGLASSHFSSLESICSCLLGCGGAWISFSPLCVEVWMDAGPSPAGLAPWVRVAPSSQLDLLLPNSELLFSGWWGRQSCV